MWTIALLVALVALVVVTTLCTLQLLRLLRVVRVLDRDFDIKDPSKIPQHERARGEHDNT